MEVHLTDEQILEIVATRADRLTLTNVDAESESEPVRHLRSCENCQLRMKTHELVDQSIDLLKESQSTSRTASCPQESIWLELAAGLQQERSHELLDHASGCEHCGRLLRDELPVNEDTLISQLRSSQPSWQARLAEQLAAGSLPKSHREPASIRWNIWSSRRIALATAIAVFIGVGIWGYLRLRPSPSARELIAGAFAEKRTLDTRFEDIGYSPLSHERGTALELNRMKRSALLDAEAKISAELSSHPTDVTWLQASGRANLLEGTVAAAESARKTLDKAHRLAPEQTSISIDLASAHLLYGELYQNSNDEITSAIQHEEDSRAIELLGPIADHYQDPVAEFNLAIALERIGFLKDADREWTKFLKHKWEGKWRTEAIERQNAVQDKIRSRDGRSNLPLKSPREIAAAFRSRNEQATLAIEDHLEEYQDTALASWLPEIYSAGISNSNKQEISTALKGLASLLIEKDNDYWLHDMLRAEHPSENMREGVRLLAASSREIETADENKAQNDAGKAREFFRDESFRPGIERAELLLILAAQYSHRNQACENSAKLLSARLSPRQYHWIRTQALLEIGICAPGGDPRGLAAVRTAYELAAQHKFRILMIRSLGAEASLYSAMGDTDKAWANAAKALQLFWKGDFPTIRGYNSLVAMDEINFPQDRWYLEKYILQEALPLVTEDPRKLMVAVEQARLGQTLIRTGELGMAEEAFQKAASLIGESPAGPQRTSLSAEIELGVANVELQQDKYKESTRVLERIQPAITHTTDDLLELEFYETAGKAYLRLGDNKQAELYLAQAVKIAEVDLRRVHSEAARTQWAHQTEAAYREFVQASLRSDPNRALLIWEWFRDASRAPVGSPLERVSLEEFSANAKDPQFFSRERNAAHVVYAFLPDGLAVWIADSTGIRERMIHTRPIDISPLALTFSEECADPESELASLRSTAARIYREIVLPVEPLLQGHTALEVETDGPLKSIPIGLLVDPGGRYLSDSFEITISPGTGYLKTSRIWTGVSQESSAIVVEGTSPGWTELLEARQEAHFVASKFAHSWVASEGSLSSANLAEEIESADVFHFSGHSTSSYGEVGLVDGSGQLLNESQLRAFGAGKVQLVVLSACSTSGGSNGTFDDSDSMVHKLLDARVPAVMASRWAVDSASTSFLMESFYSNLLNGKAPAQALDSAMQEVRAKPQFQHPYYWGGFAVFGSI